MTENTTDSEEYKGKKAYGLTDNKLLQIKKIDGFDFEDFRLFHNQTLKLGNYLTILSGRNGSMKSTLLGLMSHPYKTSEVDVHGKRMNTKFDDVFKFSLKKDTKNYSYSIKMLTNKDEKIIEPIPIYLQTEKNREIKRHRIVPSGRGKGDGFFNLPTLYTNLKRLYPLIDSGNVDISDIEYTNQEKKQIGDFYEDIILKSDFKSFDTYANSKKEKVEKNPFGPSNSYFDIDSISSGEDNLSTFINAMISFERVRAKLNDASTLTGIWAIDEFEASLHPRAQINLLRYLLFWAKKNRVQVLLNTHSLYLIDQIYKQYPNYLQNSDIVINFISPMYNSNDKLDILINPSYDIAYEELTLTKTTNVEVPIKIKIICEDDIAKHLLNRIIRKNSTKKRVEIIHSSSIQNDGISSNYLRWICKNVPKLLIDSNSIVVFDADQTIDDLDSDLAFKLPSIYNQPLEKEIACYILNKDSGDHFFSKLGKTKEFFKQEFRHYSINLSDPEETNVAHFKKWYKEKNGKQYLTEYLSENKKSIEGFRNTLISALNSVCAKIGLPPVE